MLPSFAVGDIIALDTLSRLKGIETLAPVRV